MLQAVGVQLGADGGPARRPDPGLLRHPGRQRMHRRCCSPTRKQNYDDLLVVSPDVGGVVSARAPPSAWCDWGDHRQAPPKANVSEVMSSTIGRRGRGPHLRDHGRHGRHRRHLQSSRSCRRALAKRGAKACCPTAPTRCCPGGGLAHQRSLSARQAGRHDTIPLRDDARRPRASARSRWPRCSPTPSCRISNEESVSSLFME